MRAFERAFSQEKYFHETRNILLGIFLIKLQSKFSLIYLIFLCRNIPYQIKLELKIISEKKYGTPGANNNDSLVYCNKLALCFFLKFTKLNLSGLCLSINFNLTCGEFFFAFQKL